MHMRMLQLILICLWYTIAVGSLQGSCAMMLQVSVTHVVPLLWHIAITHEMQTQSESIPPSQAGQLVLYAL